MRLKAFGLGLSLVLASQAFAASEECFEFTLIPIGIEGVADHPGIVTRRHESDNGEIHVFSQEVIALNEETQDALAGLHVGQMVCLKGTRGYNNLPKYFAYSAHRQ